MGIRREEIRESLREQAVEELSAQQQLLPDQAFGVNLHLRAARSRADGLNNSSSEEGVGNRKAPTLLL
jgi:hypothetical protein